MTLKKLTPSLHLLDDGMTRILFSFETPVAAEIGAEFYRTEQKWSRTTSGHIELWLGHHNAKLKPQSFFDELEIHQR